MYVNRGIWEPMSMGTYLAIRDESWYVLFTISLGVCSTLAKNLQIGLWYVYLNIILMAYTMHMSFVVFVAENNEDSGFNKWWKRQLL